MSPSHCPSGDRSQGPDSQGGWWIREEGLTGTVTQLILPRGECRPSVARFSHDFFERDQKSLYLNENCLIFQCQQPIQIFL